MTSQVQTSTGFTELGVETIAPIISRGVFFDVARYRGHITKGYLAILYLARRKR